ncbi:5-methylcytosine-specific restriction endonuclease system specificity protein McrC [Paraburkholderia phymatum]|uniref:5-methylcytosine-specific restriction endonuclease system specificity protein McrC n=1 Tax=Paraburkholderia phymatum TaxID=148447 RepID=UPI0012FE4E4B|nr:5-methylcytosine-specific restriction endonuclease system specificity protein McrC [Paraburkholderia phymatum]
MTTPIPIKNLWFLLSYAHNLARFADRLPVEIGEQDDIPELLGRLLAFLVERRIKRNLTRAYQPREARLTRVRGRIDLVKTLSAGELQQGRIICRFEELDADTPRNQLVRYALAHIASTVRDQALERRCGLLASELGRLGVSFRRPSRSEMAREQIGRNDADDAALIVVSNLALDPRLPSEESGDSRVARLQRDERLLPYIFEKAIAGFYMHELPNKEWRVRPQKVLAWPVASPTPGLHDLLPGMQADIVIDSRITNRRVVVDTKFTDILTRNQFGTQRFKSNYLYQMFAYLRSQTGFGDKHAEEAEGLLLHPSVGLHVDESFFVQGHRMRFATVDLGGEIHSIHSALAALVSAEPARA